MANRSNNRRQPVTDLENENNARQNGNVEETDKYKLLSTMVKVPKLASISMEAKRSFDRIYEEYAAQLSKTPTLIIPKHELVTQEVRKVIEQWKELEGGEELELQGNELFEKFFTTLYKLNTRQEFLSIMKALKMKGERLVDYMQYVGELNEIRDKYGIRQKYNGESEVEYFIQGCIPKELGHKLKDEHFETLDEVIKQAYKSVKEHEEAYIKTYQSVSAPGIVNIGNRFLGNPKSSLTSNKELGCYECGGPHLRRDCPKTGSRQYNNSNRSNSHNVSNHRLPNSRNDGNTAGRPNHYNNNKTVRFNTNNNRSDNKNDSVGSHKRSNNAGTGCFECGGPHLKKDCPTLIIGKKRTANEEIDRSDSNKKLAYTENRVFENKNNGFKSSQEIPSTTSRMAADEVTCYYCKQQGHKANNCPEKKAKKASNEEKNNKSDSGRSK